MMVYKGSETDILYGVAMDRAVMVYKGTETDVLLNMAWRANCSCVAHTRLPFLTAK